MVQEAIQDDPGGRGVAQHLGPQSSRGRLVVRMVAAFSSVWIIREDFPYHIVRLKTSSKVLPIVTPSPLCGTRTKSSKTNSALKVLYIEQLGLPILVISLPKISYDPLVVPPYPRFQFGSCITLVCYGDLTVTNQDTSPTRPLAAVKKPPTVKSPTSEKTTSKLSSA